MLLIRKTLMLGNYMASSKKLAVFHASIQIPYQRQSYKSYSWYPHESQDVSESGGRSLWKEVEW